jgi:GAF domain-containing protein
MLDSANKPSAVAQSRALALGRLGIRLQEAGDESGILQALDSGLRETGLSALVGRLDPDAQTIRIFPAGGVAARPGAGPSARGEQAIDHLAIDTQPLLGRVVRARETVYLQDCSDLLSALPAAGKTASEHLEGAQAPASAVCAPMIAHGRLAGVLVVLGSGLEVIEGPPIRILADHLAIALENSAVLTDVKQALLREHEAARELRGLETLVAELSAEEEPRAVLRRIIGAASEALGAEKIGLLLANQETHKLLLTASHGLEGRVAQALHELSYAEGQGPLGSVVAEAAPFIVEDTRKDASWSPLLSISEAAAVRSLWMVPLHSRPGEVLGVLAVFSEQTGQTGSPSQQQLDLAQRYARHAALAIVAGRREESQKQEARTEALVGLARSIPHELSQPLAIIAGYAELIADGLLEGESLREACGDIVEASARLVERIQRLEQLTSYTTREAAPGRTVVDFEPPT